MSTFEELVKDIITAEIKKNLSVDVYHRQVGSIGHESLEVTVKVIWDYETIYEDLY